MNALLHKKGLELAIGTVAILTIVLIVVIIVVSFFLGGFGRAGEGILDISEEGEKGAGELELDFKCLGTPRMSAQNCEKCNEASLTCTLCPPNGKKCFDITDKDECSDIRQARGCYWGYGQ